MSCNHSVMAPIQLMVIIVSLYRLTFFVAAGRDWRAWEVCLWRSCFFADVKFHCHTSNVSIYDDTTRRSVTQWCSVNDVGISPRSFIVSEWNHSALTVATPVSSSLLLFSVYQISDIKHSSVWAGSGPGTVDVLVWRRNYWILNTCYQAAQHHVWSIWWWWWWQVQCTLKL